MYWCSNHLNCSEPSSDQSKAGRLVLWGTVSHQSPRELFRTPSCDSLRNHLLWREAATGASSQVMLPPHSTVGEGSSSLCMVGLETYLHPCRLPAERSLVLTPLFSLYTMVLMILSTFWQSSNHGACELVHKDNQLLLLLLVSDPLTFGDPK